jgi:hypothetical protein
MQIDYRQWLIVESGGNVSNPAQNPGRYSAIVTLPELGAISEEVKSMELYRPLLRRLMGSAGKFLGTLLASVRPQTQEVRSQRVCPFCGLITPRAKRVCLECGNSLSAVSLERKANQT